MVIQNNIPAINSHRNLMINNSNLAQNLERLSSGFRINRAGDDAAGLAISERMRTQIRGLAMAEQNTTNGINLIQTAEGGLNETHAILQRMRELAVMSSNATFQPSDREQIHLEVVALIDEIDRIASSTHYNRINLLDGSFASTAHEAGNMGFAALTATSIAFPDAAAVTAGTGSRELAGVTSLNTRIIVTELPDMDGATADNFAVALQVGDNTFMGTITGNDIVFRNNDGLTVATMTGALTGGVAGLEAGVISNLRLSGTEAAPVWDNSQAQVATRGDNILRFQIGANGGLGQRASLQVNNMSSAALGATDINDHVFTVRDIGRSQAWDATAGAGAGAWVFDTGVPQSATETNHGVSILTQNGSNAAIAVIDAAIDAVSAQRAGLGALQNRLESTLNSLGVARENLTAAESTIRDVDMAAEMMRFTQNNILTQASQAMLAQANQIPQGVLQLLR